MAKLHLPFTKTQAKFLVTCATEQYQVRDAEKLAMNSFASFLTKPSWDCNRWTQAVANHFEEHKPLLTEDERKAWLCMASLVLVGLGVIEMPKLKA